MKHGFLILPLALTLVLGACTSNQDPTPDDQPTTLAPDTTLERPGEDILGDGVTPDSDLYPQEGDTMDDSMDDSMGDDFMEDLEDMVVPYDEMVENGMVHDTDGALTDGENHKSD